MNAKLHYRADVNHLTGVRRQSLYPNIERCTCRNEIRPEVS